MCPCIVTRTSVLLWQNTYVVWAHVGTSREEGSHTIKTVAAVNSPTVELGCLGGTVEVFKEEAGLSSILGPITCVARFGERNGLVAVERNIVRSN